MFWFTTDTVEEFVSNPIWKTIDIVTSPIRDWIEVIEWLTEWELTTKAIAKLWIEVATTMTVSELVEWYNNN